MHIQAIERAPRVDHEVAKVSQNRARNRFANIFPCTQVVIGIHKGHGVIFLDTPSNHPMNESSKGFKNSVLSVITL